MTVRFRLFVIALMGVAQATSARAYAQASGGAIGPSTDVPLSAFDRAKAQSLLEKQLPCLGCHAMGSAGGKLAPDLATVRDRRDADYVARMIMDPQATVPGTFMPHTPMPPATRALIVRYLGGNAGLLDASHVPTRATVTDSTGAALYARFCTGCHGVRGNGDGPNAASLPVPPAQHASRARMSERPDDSLYDTIAGGGAIMNRSPRMPAYGTTLTPSEIRALVRHIRTLCQCTGPSWSTDGGRP